MTKSVRIENADTGAHKVDVEVWDKGQDGEPDELRQTLPLDFPTAICSVPIWRDRYLVIRERHAQQE